MRALGATGEGYTWIAGSALAYAAATGIPGAAEADAWYRANVYPRLVDLPWNPKWAILPRSRP